MFLSVQNIKRIRNLIHFSMHLNTDIITSKYISYCGMVTGIVKGFLRVDQSSLVYFSFKWFFVIIRIQVGVGTDKLLYPITGKVLKISPGQIQTSTNKINQN